ncbi:MAG: hypothetical protein LBU88_08605 [Treponema sp.]|jgi:hypothetical protein|nr:hypothetical protein [Treponema sp.]
MAKVQEKQFFEKLKTAAEEALQEGDGFIIGDANSLIIEDQVVGISGDERFDLFFDNNGNAGSSMSKKCVGVNVNISAYIDDCDPDLIVNVTVTTNYPERFDFIGKKPGEAVSFRMKTNFWSSTTINLNVHSNKPNSKATVYLHYST